MTILVSDIKSGGGFVPVGSPAQFDDRERLINDGGVLYLKTGEVEPNFANYPNFPIKYYSTGDSFSPTGNGNITDIALGGGFLWVVFQDNTLRSYNYDGTPASVDFILTAGGGGAVNAITYLNGDIYAIHSNAEGDRLVKYDVSTETGTLITTQDGSSISTDNTYLYIDNSKFTVTGTLVDTFSVTLGRGSYDPDIDGFMLALGGTYRYVDKQGNVIDKINYSAWEVYPDLSGGAKKTTDNSLVFTYDTTTIYKYERGVFGGLSPEVNNANAIGGSTVYWRIR